MEEHEHRACQRSLLEAYAKASSRLPFGLPQDSSQPSSPKTPAEPQTPSCTTTEGSPAESPHSIHSPFPASSFCVSKKKAGRENPTTPTFTVQLSPHHSSRTVASLSPRHERKNAVRTAVDYFEAAFKIWKQVLEEGSDDRSTAAIIACCNSLDDIHLVLQCDSSTLDSIDFGQAIDLLGSNVEKGEWLYSLCEALQEPAAALALMRAYAKRGGNTYLRAAELSQAAAPSSPDALSTLLACCETSDQAATLMEPGVDDAILVKAIQLSGDAEKAEFLYSLCQHDTPISANHALLQVFASCKVGLNQASKAFNTMAHVDSGLLGMVYACCQTEAEVTQVPEAIQNLSEITSETISFAIEYHYGTIVGYLYDTLIEHCEPDEWCCQTLIKAHARGGGDHYKAMEVYQELQHQGIDPNEWTVASIITCCSTEAQVRDVLETVSGSISFNKALAKAMELCDENIEKVEMLFELSNEITVGDLLLSSHRKTEWMIEKNELVRIVKTLNVTISLACGLNSIVWGTSGKEIVLFKKSEMIVGMSCNDKPLILKTRYYVTNSKGTLLDPKYADVVKHFQYYSQGAMWVVVGDDDAIRQFYHGGSRKELMHVLRVIVVKRWVRRCLKKAGLDHFVDFLVKEEMMQVMESFTGVWKQQLDTAHALDQLEIETESSDDSAHKIDITKLRNAFEQTSGRGKLGLKRIDIINSKVIQKLLHPIEKYFDCEKNTQNVITLEGFLREVKTRWRESQELPKESFGTEGVEDVLRVPEVGEGGCLGEVVRNMGVGVGRAAGQDDDRSRRALAVRFLRNIACEHEPLVKETVQDWLRRTMVAHHDVKSLDFSNGLLLGGTGDGAEVEDIVPTEKRSKRFIAHPNIDTWEAIENVVQPLILRVGGLPILSCSYVQTFETKAEKAEKRRLEKRRREQDALDLLLPDDGRANGKKLHTLASIKETFALRRARKKRPPLIFYKSLLEQTQVPFDPKESRKISVNSDTSEDRDGSSMGAEHRDMGNDGLSLTSDKRSDMTYPYIDEYDPNLLDDPEIKSEKKRKLLSMPSLRATVIPYSKSKDLKKDVNQQFLLTHPWIEETGLSLTGIRKAKMIMINLALQDDPSIEASTVAYAVVYFERLILKQIVTKANRKLVASVCCVLAYKFWESPVDIGNAALHRLLSELEEHFDVSRKRVLQAEFKIYALLNFDLLIHRKHAEPHFERLLALYNITAQEYLNRKDDSWGLTLREEGTAPVVKMTNQ